LPLFADAIRLDALLLHFPFCPNLLPSQSGSLLNVAVCSRALINVEVKAVASGPTTARPARGPPGQPARPPTRPRPPPSSHLCGQQEQQNGRGRQQYSGSAWPVSLAAGGALPRIRACLSLPLPGIGGPAVRQAGAGPGYEVWVFKILKAKVF